MFATDRATIMPAHDVPGAGANKAFFSYARKDAGFVLKVASELRADGRALWLDQLDIPKGARWDESVEAALKECWCLVVVLSPASAVSSNVQDEVSYALEEGKRVIPLLLGPCAVPFRLRRIQYIDFTAGYEQAYRDLLAAVTPPGASKAAPSATASAAAGSAPPVAAGGGAARPSVRPAPATRGPGWLSWKSTVPALAAGLATLGAALILAPRDDPAAADPARLPEPAPPVGVQVPQALPQKAADPGPPEPEPKQESAPAPAPDLPAPAPTADPVPAVDSVPAPAAVPDSAEAGITDQQLTDFVARYLAAQSGGDLASVLALYDARVRYFGDKIVDQEFIRNDKQRYYRRWPQVENRLTGPVYIERLAGDHARLSFAISWLVRSPQKKAAGTARNELEVRLVDGKPKIVAERQTVHGRGKPQ